MKPAPFEYHAPATLAEAVNLLQQYEDDGIDAKILAGGQSLMPMLALRVARPDVLIDLRQVAGLTGVREEDGMLAVGAMEPKQTMVDSPLVRQRQPLFQAASEWVGHRQIRNRGSVGGSFAHADPASEYPAVALVLGMEMKAVGPDGERIIPADEFFVTYMTTALESTEVLAEVRIPVMAPGTRWAIQEMARRNGDLALAGVTLTLRMEGGLCSDARIAAFGVNATAVRLTAAEEALEGQPADAALFARAAAAGAEALEEPMTCIHASADYRRHLVKVLTERCLAEAVGRSA